MNGIAEPLASGELLNCSMVSTAKLYHGGNDAGEFLFWISKRREIMSFHWIILNDLGFAGSVVAAFLPAQKMSLNCNIWQFSVDIKDLNCV
jgi:hypothetical protein